MEDSYRKYFDAMPCFLTVHDRKMRLVDANKRFRDDFGDYEGRFCYQVYKQRSERCEECPVDRTFRDGQIHSAQERVRCLDDREVSAIVYTTPIKDNAGKIVSVVKLSTDITDIKLWQEQLRDSQERYHMLFEEVPCYISIQNENLKIVEANRRFREDFGSFLGCNCYEIYKHRTEECFPCPVQETFKDGNVRRSEEVVTSRKGEKMNVLVYTAPIYDSKGNISNVMEMSTNITPIRQLQSQLESIGLLISSISHSIKGLLTGLDGGMYLVNSGMKKNDPSRIKRGWEMVQRNVDRVRDTVLNILYYAKERDPSFQEVSAYELTEEVCDLIEERALGQNVRLIRSLDISAGELECDKKAVRSLLVNLAENSVDACRVDKKKIDHFVTIGVKGNSRYVEFRIDDNGIGMDQETREKAFSLFFSSKGAEGTGLGLFIASNITHVHGGSIELESKLDQGSCFTVRIPRKRTMRRIQQ